MCRRNARRWDVAAGAEAADPVGRNRIEQLVDAPAARCGHNQVVGGLEETSRSRGRAALRGNPSAFRSGAALTVKMIEAVDVVAVAILQALEECRIGKVAEGRLGRGEMQEQQGATIGGRQAVDGLEPSVAQSLPRDPMQPLLAAERPPYGGFREVDGRLGDDLADLDDDRVDDAPQQIAEKASPHLRMGRRRQSVRETR